MHMIPFGSIVGVRTSWSESYPKQRRDVMMRSTSQIQKSVDRRAFIGASDAHIIMGEDEAALVRLWREKRGEVEPEGLSSNLIVQLSTVTEHLNRHWYERNSGRVVTDVLGLAGVPNHRDGCPPSDGDRPP